MTDTAATVHAGAVDIGGRGVLIEGPPGSGKSSLALGLLDAARARGTEAALVSDDRTILVLEAGSVIASAPASLAGLVEIRGFGIARIAAKPRTTLALVARLTPDEEVDRMPPPRHARLLGVDVPLLLAPRRHEAQAVRIVLAFLAGQGDFT